MNHVAITRLCAFASVVFVVLPANTGLAGSTSSTLLKLEHTWMQAAQHHNVPVLTRILADDFVDINYKGIVRHKSDVLKTPNLKMKRYTQHLSDEKVRLFGDAAIVTGRGVLTRDGGGDVAAWRFTDVFVKRAGVWQAVSAQETVERNQQQGR